MIIQHPDGSYECCLLPPTAVLWLRTLLRRARALITATGRSHAPGSTLIAGELCSGCDGGRCS